MLEHIISKIVLDMTCPICNGLKHYKDKNATSPQSVVCKNCNGKGRLYEDTHTVLCVDNLEDVPAGVVNSMGLMNIHVVGTNNEDYLRLGAVDVTRLYTYNVSIDHEAFRFMRTRCIRTNEIHMYFS
jgi:hypothetical protein